MFYETKDHHGLKHNPFKALVSPRPIGWVSSMDTEGRLNLAPFSFFNAMSDNPPTVVLGFSGVHSEGGPKDTLANIEQTGEFVCNVVTYEIRDAMNATSEMAARAVNEFDLGGVTALPSTLVKPPRVGESPVNMECRYLQTIDLPSNDPERPNKMVIGQVLGIHINDDILTDGMVDMTKFHPLARLGYKDYTAVKEVFSLSRPDQEKQDRNHR
ncbi:flavin reductase family protein [Sneathiella chinensis]|uniref:Flavin reductase n=1 Tax=Sneathiella chinensis TaxID=349750 RepID=A0ABQ5U1M4_9PROT|nr:flavin reductase family protein [Sneathiella chinensis]GLQ05723.1 flavin reductase [Sneathiella chinensis]